MIGIGGNMGFGTLASSRRYMGGSVSDNNPPEVSAISVTNPSGNRFVLSYVYFDADGDVEDDQLPYATNVSITGVPAEGITLESGYDFNHDNGKAEGTSLFIWEAADDDEFTENVTTLSTTEDYLLTSSEIGKYIRFGVRVATTGGTQAAGYSYSLVTSQVTTALVDLKFNIVMGSASSPSISDTETWNELYTNDPTGSYESSDLEDSEGNSYAGMTIDIDLTMSDYNNGPTGAGRYPANVCRGSWYPSQGATRGFILNIHPSLQGYQREIEIIGGTAEGTTRQLIASVAGQQKILADTADNVDDYLHWNTTELAATVGQAQITFRFESDGQTISSNCSAVVVIFKVPS